MPKNIQDIDVVVLAGGLGTRLRSIITSVPKVLANVDGRPFIYYLLDSLCNIGICRVILSTGYQADQLEKSLGVQYKSIHISYSKESTPLGTGGALRFATKYIEKDLVLVMNGDSFVDVNYGDFLSWHVDRGVEVSIVVKTVVGENRYETVILDPESNIVEIVGRNAKARDKQSFINAGVYLIQKRSLQKLPKRQVSSLEKDFLPLFVGADLSGYYTNGAFIDIGTPESLKRAPRFFKLLQRNGYRPQICGIY